MYRLTHPFRVCIRAHVTPRPPRSQLQCTPPARVCVLPLLQAGPHLTGKPHHPPARAHQQRPSPANPTNPTCACSRSSRLHRRSCPGHSGRQPATMHPSSSPARAPAPPGWTAGSTRQSRAGRRCRGQSRLGARAEEGRAGRPGGTQPRVAAAVCRVPPGRSQRRCPSAVPAVWHRARGSPLRA